MACLLEAKLICKATNVNAPPCLIVSFVESFVQKLVLQGTNMLVTLRHLLYIVSFVENLIKKLALQATNALVTLRHLLVQVSSESFVAYHVKTNMA